MPSAGESSQTERILERVAAGERSAVDELLQSQRNYVRRVIDLRMEDELRVRVDPSDIVQETMIVVSNRVDDFLERRPTSFRLWIRRKAIERLIEARRKHLAGRRSVRRELTLRNGRVRFPIIVDSGPGREH